MEILPASEIDLINIMKIEQATFPVDSFDEETLVELIRRAIIFLKVVDEDSQALIGYALCTKLKNLYYKIRGLAAEIASIALIANFQGLGYGSLLMTKIMDELEFKHIKVIQLQVDVNNPRAIQLYSHFGFEIVETITQYYSESKNDAYLMVRMP